MNQQIKQRIKQIKNGEVPYGYKKIKIGIVPNEWKEFYLEDLFNVIDGDRGEKYPSKDEIFDEGYCVFLNAKNITKNGFDFDHIQYISEEKDKELRNGKLEKFDIVLTTRGTIGNVALNDNIKYENLRINSGMVLLRSENLKYIKYVYMYMKSKLFIHQVDKISFGSAQPQLTVKEIKKFKVVIPINETEQQKIADILSTQDKVIELKVKLLKEKEKQKKYLMQNLLTGRKRLKGFNGEWKKVKLGEICYCLDNLRKPLNANERIKIKGNYPYYGANGVVDYISDYIFETDIILLAEDGGNFEQFETKPIAIFVDEKCWVNNHAHILKAKEEHLNLYIFYSLQHKDIRKYINGTTRTKLTKSDMEEIILEISMDIEEQKAIAEILTTADKELKLLQEELEEEKRKKKVLMQLLLTGIVRVKV
ncbi:MAG TPA: restriction endonuclease subunit S [Candidatus Dwaynia gallinarum]|nr:restriction endonuclease subunit S [Candidatus Dwaynia gallinarum]